MNKIKVIRLATTTDHPEEYLNNLVKITFSKQLNKGQGVIETILDTSPSELKLLNNIIKMNHTSILEQVDITYAIIGASRSFLAQATRHRMSSFLSSSQHYIDHTEMNDYEVPIEIIELNNPEVTKIYLEGCEAAKASYDKLVNELGIDHAVARQTLPNAQRNTLIMKANLRSWMNFLNLRLCARNTSEIEYVAWLIKQDLNKYIPNVSKYFTPDCVVKGHCTQGKMCCRTKYSDENERKKFEVINNED
ncbi:MAG: FAD-dependent thymidylate synthase [Burkholderiales bacterium]|nr:FAD-dependent thymidylate synthase [Burkholderiales bacterium]